MSGDRNCECGHTLGQHDDQFCTRPGCDCEAFIPDDEPYDYTGWEDER